ncbi:zinc-binding dehydrogenase [Streptomyces sp. NPDC041068]|uniref:alcohol dehydrogenase catalytic domain-containing protein n=1 Tax=Streptomyces sp. NPDC041068 TaxID=3155130 RepID=UPI0033D9299A
MFAVRYHRYGGSEVLVMEEAEEPHAGPGQLRIAVRATGITPADWYLRSGMLRDVAALDFPHIPGMDAAGTVDEVGESPGWAGLPLAADLADRGPLTIPLHAVFPLKEAATAHDTSATGHARGKIVIAVP